MTADRLGSFFWRAQAVFCYEVSSKTRQWRVLSDFEISEKMRRSRVLPDFCRA